MRSVILGCGDIGRRLVKVLESSADLTHLHAYVNSDVSLQAAAELGVDGQVIDLDDLQHDLVRCDQARLYYTVAPQKKGQTDERSRAVLNQFTRASIRPAKVVLISTTGVYGDCAGGWVDETAPARPQTERGKRRLDSELQWLNWGHINAIDVVVLRVPGIYAFSRIPRARLEKRTPVVRASECGFTNRIHADDLARVCEISMRHAAGGELFNVTDGTPGKITEYLQAAANVVGLPPLPEISMRQAKSELSEGMLSYLGESRKISNRKMLSELGVELLHTDFKDGLRA